MKHIVFDGLYPCGCCEILRNFKEDNDTTLLEVKLTHITDKDTLFMYLGKKVNIGDIVVLNKVEVKNKVTQEMFQALINSIDFNIFSDVQKIDIFEELYSKNIYRLTGVRKDIRNQLSKREWIELLEAFKR
jgi:hypothetical protein